MSRLQEIREQLAAVSPGPWKVDPPIDDDYQPSWGVEGPAWATETDDRIAGTYFVEEHGDRFGRPEDAEFIAAAPENIAWLIQRVIDLEHKLAEARDQSDRALAVAKNAIEVAVDVQERAS